MDRLERIEDFQNALLAALDGFQSGLWTAMPGIIESYDSTKNTCTVKCGLKARARSIDGTPPLPGAIPDKNDWWWVEMPIFVDVPVVFPSGGGFILTFPLFPGDPCLLVFGSRCIDAHWQSGGVQIQSELRMHSLSDGFAIPGHRPLPQVPAAISNSSVVLRSDDGLIYVELTRDQVINVQASGGVNITGPVTISGDTEITGMVQITGQVFMNGKEVDDLHTHSGVTPGTGNTGPVI